MDYLGSPEDVWTQLKAKEVSDKHPRNWAQDEYKKLYNEYPPRDWGQPVRTHASDEEKAQELDRLKDIQRTKGLKEGFPAAAYKNQNGHWPPKDTKPKPASHDVTRSLAPGDTCPTCAQIVPKRMAATGNMQDDLPF